MATEITCPKSGPLTTTLTSAITSSLTHLGYDPHLIQRVSLLTTSNTHTAVCALSPSSNSVAAVSKSALTSASSDALSSLFADIEAKGTRVNSNEPVLLVNAIRHLDATDLHALTDAVAAALRDEHHVRPVRIYAGNFTRDIASSGEVGKDATFSIALLNVVNTDIGGPGMVQLLDMVDWQAKGCVRREHWEANGWNCVLREDHDAEFVNVDAKEEGVSENGGSETGEGEWESEPEASLEQEREEGPVKESTAEEVKEGKYVKPEHSESVEPVYVPERSENTTTSAAAKTTQELEINEAEAEDADEPWSQRPQLRDIKHPSWEREHDKESLLDMIARQSQRLPISKGGGAGGSGGNSYATAAKGVESEGEEEYELV